MPPTQPARRRDLRPSSVLICLLLAAPATATPPQNPFAQGADSVLPWTGPGPSPPTPTRGFAGDFTGDLLTDAVYLHAGGGATLVYGPSHHTATVALSPTIRDITRVPTQALGGTDRLAIVDHEGLKRLEAYDAGTFVEHPVALGAPWDTALRVVIGDVTADGRLDAVGVGSDGVSLLVREDSSASALPTTNFTVPFPVLDLAILDWSPAPAIAILTTGGLVVRTADGSSLVDYIGGTFTSGKIAPFHQDGLPHDRLAILYAAQGLGEYLSVVDRNGPGVTLPLGPIEAYALAAGDVDRNLSDDLVVLQRTTHQALLFVNQNLPVGAFGPLEIIDIAPGTPGASTSSAAPILADVFHDGDLDLIVHVDTNEELAILPNGQVASGPLGPQVVSGTYFYSDANEQGDLKLKVAQPVGLGFTPNAIEWTVWAENHLDTGKMSPQAVDHGIFYLDALGQTDATVTLHEPKLETSKLYHIDMRGVRVVEGAPAQVGPSRIWAFATPTADVAELQASSGNLGVKLRIFLEDELRFLTVDEEEDRILTPTTIPTGKIPPIDEPPDPFGD